MNYNIEYFVNEKKKVVVCKLSNCEGSIVCDMCKQGWPPHPDLYINDVFIGKARCSEDDVFDVEIGKKIAYKRAVMKLNMAKIRTINKFADYQRTLTKSLEDVTTEMSEKYERIYASKAKELNNLFND